MISGLSTEQEPNFDGKHGEFIHLGFSSHKTLEPKRCVQKAKFVKKTLGYTTETRE
jgi:hypothetical protein